jgi:hypothetical protein
MGSVCDLLDAQRGLSSQSERRSRCTYAPGVLRTRRTFVVPGGHRVRQLVGFSAGRRWKSASTSVPDAGVSTAHSPHTARVCDTALSCGRAWLRGVLTNCGVDGLGSAKTTICRHPLPCDLSTIPADERRWPEGNLLAGRLRTSVLRCHDACDLAECRTLKMVFSVPENRLRQRELSTTNARHGPRELLLGHCPLNTCWFNT